jgi:hypothetical protein
LSSPRTRRKARLTGRSRAAIGWGLAFFLLAQAACLLLTRVDPGIADEEFAHKLGLLKRVIRENPGRPLVLMFGTSRVATGFRPSSVASAWVEAGSDSGVVLFNFSLVGRGPEMAHLALQRLLDAGIRPDRVLIEFWPASWCSQASLSDYKQLINIAGLDRREMRLIGGYLTAKDRARLERLWLGGWAAPIFSNRFAILHRYAPSWLAVPPRAPNRHCQNVDALGWWRPVTAVTREERRALEDQYSAHYGPRLANFRPSQSSDSALRDILTLCRRERIEPAIVILPEASEFRGLYPAETLTRVDSYLARLKREWSLPVIDARTWVADDGFMDAHHLLPRGAIAFSERLGREAIAPVLASRSEAIRR